MAFISVLTPAFTLNSSDHEVLKMSCAGHLGIETGLVDLYALVPAADVPDHSGEYALKLSKSECNLHAIEDLL
jgi:hypothetical protein